MENSECRESKKDAWKAVSGIVAGVQAFATLALVIVLLYFGWNMYVAKEKVSSTAASILSGEGTEEKLKAGASKAKEFLEEHNATERAKAGAKAGFAKLGNALLDKAPGMAEKALGSDAVNSTAIGGAIRGAAEAKGKPFKERIKAGWSRFQASRATKEVVPAEPQPQYFEMMTPGIGNGHD